MVYECCRLRIQDVDLARNQIVVRGGKGDKDRMTMLPAVIKPAVRTPADRLLGP
jgi:site-specific recombinase XerD